MKKEVSNYEFHVEVINLLQAARNHVARAINNTMVYAYYEIGRKIVEEEQRGQERAEYGKSLLKSLSKVLTVEFGKGFSVTNIQQMRAFYLSYQKQQTLSVKSKEQNTFTLSWSHYLKLMKMDDLAERRFYEIESEKNQWSIRELQRQFDSGLYLRLALSRDKIKVKELSEEGLILKNPKDAIKDPYVLEFLGLPEHSSYSEKEVEQELINKLEEFMLELGTGFTFVKRQKRITFEERHFRIDLVFYNRILRCFVLIDIKIGELKHQDIGQMQMYVNYYDREVKLDEENKTIGLILCKSKSESVVKYTLPEENEQIFASKYKTVLPKIEELKGLIEEKK